MLRFRRFKASFSTSTTKSSNLVHYDYTPGVSLTGAYRSNKDELFGSVNYSNPSKTITPDMVTLPGASSGGRKKISKSTSNLAQPLTSNSAQPLTINSTNPLTSNSAQPLNETVNITISTPNIPQAVPKPLTQIKEQQKVEKKRLEEQKKQEKLAVKEKEKAEKLRKEMEKQEQKRKAEEKKKTTAEEKKKIIAEQKKLTAEQKKSTAEQKKSTAEEKKSKRKAPQPQPQADNVQGILEISTPSDRQQSTNTLESSISKSSGPPPYTPQENIINNKSDNSGNTSFASDDSTSWNMISQHRQEINRPLVVKSLPKQTHLDLQYNVDTTTTNNSDA